MGILRSGAKNTGHPTGRLVRDGPQPHVDITHHFLGPALTDPRLVPAAVPHLAQPADQDAPSLSSGKHAHDLVVTASCPDNPGGTVVLDAIDDVTTTHQYVARHDHHLVHRHDVLVLDRLGVHDLSPRIDTRSTGGQREPKSWEITAHR